MFRQTMIVLTAAVGLLIAPALALAEGLPGKAASDPIRGLVDAGDTSRLLAEPLDIPTSHVRQIDAQPLIYSKKPAQSQTRVLTIDDQVRINDPDAQRNIDHIMAASGDARGTSHVNAQYGPPTNAVYVDPAAQRYDSYGDSQAYVVRNSGAQSDQARIIRADPVIDHSAQLTANYRSVHHHHSNAHLYNRHVVYHARPVYQHKVHHRPYPYYMGHPYRHHYPVYHCPTTYYHRPIYHHRGHYHHHSRVGGYFNYSTGHHGHTGIRVKVRF